MDDTPRLRILCAYPDTPLKPTEVSFGLSPCYGINDAREAHAWFLEMMREHEEFEMETDRVEELAMRSWSETVRTVVARTAVPFLLTLMCLLPSHASAQAGPSAGDRIRIGQMDGKSPDGYARYGVGRDDSAICRFGPSGVHHRKLPVPDRDT